jgi:hypothetical protein
MDRPTIDSRVVPPPDRLAKARRVSKTTLIGDLLAAYLARQTDADVTVAERSRPRAAGCGPRWPAPPAQMACCSTNRHATNTRTPS